MDPQPRRRTADLSAVSVLALGIPDFLLSLMAMLVVVAAFTEGGLPVAGWLVFAAWLASGALMFLQGSERFLARSVFRLREPNASEWAHLRPLWEQVTRSARVDPAGYPLWIEDAPELNASAMAGHTVSVTSGAMRQVPPRALTAILAHELGHHVGGHAWATTLVYWYAIPGRIALWLLGLLVSIALGIGRAIAHLGLVGAALSLVIVVLVLIVAVYALPVVALLYVLSLVTAVAHRQGELKADRFAVELGFGPALLESLYATQSLDEMERSRLGFAGRFLSGHPSHARRIEAVSRLIAPPPAGPAA